MLRVLRCAALACGANSPDEAGDARERGGRPVRCELKRVNTFCSLCQVLKNRITQPATDLFVPAAAAREAAPSRRMSASVRAPLCERPAVRRNPSSARDPDSMAVTEVYLRVPLDVLVGFAAR